MKLKHIIMNFLKNRPGGNKESADADAELTIRYCSRTGKIECHMRGVESDLGAAIIKTMLSDRQVDKMLHCCVNGVDMARRDAWINTEMERKSTLN